MALPPRWGTRTCSPQGRLGLLPLHRVVCVHAQAWSACALGTVCARWHHGSGPLSPTASPAPAQLHLQPPNRRHTDRGPQSQTSSVAAATAVCLVGESSSRGGPGHSNPWRLWFWRRVELVSKSFSVERWLRSVASPYLCALLSWLPCGQLFDTNRCSALHAYARARRSLPSPGRT